MNTLVVGLGHPDRGDDAAGWLVADLLERRAQLTVRRLCADPSTLLTEPWWLEARRVVLIDAVRTGAEPGTVHRFDLDELLDASPVTGAGTHDLGIATTLRLARSLDRLPER
ncbi:MAG: hydrogenase maturation protease, partial [Nitriliruptoraceae bacterium]